MRSPLRRQNFARSGLALLIGLGITSVAGVEPSGVFGAGSQAVTHKVDLAYVKKQIQKARAIPRFVAPGPAFNAHKAKGKTIFVIPQTSEVPFVALVANSITKVAHQVGVNSVNWPTRGQPTQWIQGIDQAIAQKASLIVLGAPPDQLQPQLQQAKNAGIPVVNLHLYDKTMARPKGIAAFVYAPFAESGRLEADWVIQDTKGKADTLVVTSNEVPPSQTIVQSIQTEFQKRCSTCKTTVVNVPAVDWGTKMQTSVQSALLADSNINYIIPLYDSASQFIAPAITAAHKEGVVKIATYNNTPFVLKLIQDGNIVAMDTGESPDWLAYANMDQVLRILSGVNPLKNEAAPLRLFTKSNVNQAGVPPESTKGFGSAYRMGYLKLWKFR